VRLSGSLTVPGDKSISHRIVLVSLLSSNACVVTNLSPGADVQSSLDAVMRLGCRVRTREEGTLIEGGRGEIRENAHVDAGNSGTTMRLLMGILAGRPGSFTLDGDDSLRRRPMERVAGPLRNMGAHIQTTGGTCPVRITGTPLRGIQYALPMPSAQLKSALLFAGLQAEGVTEIVEPVPSRDHTERLIRLLGGTLQHEGRTWVVKPSTLTFPGSFWVPGDASSAAFFVCAAAIVQGSHIVTEGVLLNPTRTGFVSVLQRMNAAVETEMQGNEPEPWGRITSRYSPRLTACRVTASEVPLLVDEIPVLTLVATQAEGISIFEGVGELRVKESDRLSAVVSQLGALGGDASMEGDNLIVQGPTRLKPARNLQSFGDHRIAMTLHLAGLVCGVRNEVQGDECMAISFPRFSRVLEALAK
jgi:3-phosphoshikimate 1-carboxyvinyltransferase